MYEGLETVVLFEELAYEDVLPVRWHMQDSAALAHSRALWFERNVKLLETCISLEEEVHVDKPDERSPHHAELLRLDMKVSLLMELVGRVYAAAHPLPESRSIRFNSLGATVTDSMLKASVGAVGVLEIYLQHCLFEPLRFSGRVVSVSDDGLAKVKFDNPGEATADLLEKLAFIRHRRQVAVFKRTASEV